MKFKLTLVLAASSLISLSVHADLMPPAHILGDHNFMPISLLPAPFADTQTGLLVAGGYGNYPTSGNTGLNLTDHLELGSAEVLFNVQIAPTPWLALSLGTSVNTVAGLDAVSATAFGASVEHSWAIGAIGQILRTDQLVLSVALDVQFPHYNSISPTELIPNFNRNFAFNTPDFTNTDVTVVWKPNIRFVYALNSTFGLHALLGAKIFQLSDDNPDASTFKGNLGVGLSADLKPALHVPVGLTAAYFRSQIVTSGDFNANIFSFGIWQTQVNNAAFGLELGFGDVVGQDSTTGAVTARIYY